MGLKDFYVASVKGAIYSQYAEAVLVDISHQVEPFNLLETAFIVRNCYQDFPKGTVHVICVNDNERSDPRFIAVLHKGHYFLCADNGVIDLLLKEKPEKVIEIQLSSENDESTFASRDILATAAAFIARGGTLEFLGKETNDYKKGATFGAMTTDNEITGSVTYIDSYGNAVTNIEKTQFNLIGKNRPFTIGFGRSDFSIDRISKDYGEVPSGEKLALFGASGHLEIAINKGTVRTGGGASQLLGLQVAQKITISFENVTNR